MNHSENTISYALALLLIEGLGAIRLRRLLVEFGSPEAVVETDRELLSQSVGDKLADKIKASLSNPKIPKMLKQLQELNVKAIVWGQSEYPDRLLKIYAAPPILFVLGNLVPQDERAVAIVGTRKPSHIGERITMQIADGLARSGVTIVSGLAIGIDGIAHKASLDAGGRTIAVLANGPEIVYPRVHQKLAERILERGALISEFPPETPPSAHNFPRRNRIISGISLGVLVVEAGAKSGALITSTHALEQGREVFAVPGPPTSLQSFGTNKLIKDGAKLVTCAQDIIDALELPIVAPQQLSDAFDKVKKLSGAAKVLFEAISNEPIHIDELSRNCKMDTAFALQALFMLEMQELIRQLPGKRFVRNV